MRAALGIWICELACPSSRPRSSALDDTLTRLSTVLNEAGEGPGVDLFRYDPKLTFLVEIVQRSRGQANTRVTRFAEDIATALERLEHVPPRFMGEAVLLARLGYFRKPSIAEIDRHLPERPLTLLLADEERLRSTCNDLAAATIYGRHPLAADDPHGAAELGRVLGTILVQNLRQYDLDLAALLLRVLNYIGLGNAPEAIAAVRFIGSQQQHDGRFGYFSAECEDLAFKRVEKFDAIRDVYLPTTVACLWALAEGDNHALRLIAGPA